jgi:hypothetical protein
MRRSFFKIAAVLSAQAAILSAPVQAADEWKVGDPIVSYWGYPGYPCGGDLAEASAKQLAGGGWSLVWCKEKDLDLVQRHGLRGMVTADLLSWRSLDDAARRAGQDAFIGRVHGDV